MSGHGTAARDERIGLLGLDWGMGLEARMGDRLAAAGGALRNIVDVRIGDSGKVGSSRIVGELTDTDAALRGGKWSSFSSDAVRGVRGGMIILFPSNLTRGESIVVNCENWDGDIGASSGPSTFVSLFILLTLRLIRRT